MMRFEVVPRRSQVEAVMSSSVHPIHATANGLRGWIEGELDADGRANFEAPHSARLELPVDALSSGNRFQDIEMQRRMEARKHPTIEITVEKAWAEAEVGDRARFTVSAHGVTRRYEDGFTLKVDGSRLVVEGEHEFDMRDFGISPPRFLTLKVSPQVRVRVRIEAEAQASSKEEQGDR